MTTYRSHQALNDTVIRNGYCIGCGGCAVLEQSPFSIAMDAYGRYQATLQRAHQSSDALRDYEKLCPFGAGAPNEDELATTSFSDFCEYSDQVGYYNGSFVGHVAEGEFRRRGASGGMGTWLPNELLSKGLVDHVVHVGSARTSQDANSVPFMYALSDTPDEILRGSKSRYYPITLVDALKVVRSNPGRYAVVGLPCFIKGIRLLQLQDPVLAERIRYCVGLVCGHLKSARYAESLAWQMNIAPQDLEAIDFRVKDASQPSNRYSTYAKGGAVERVVPNNQLFGTDWGAGAFKYKACDFCDDVFAETADAVVGDAWLPEYVQDRNGTNLVVTRSNDILQLILDAREEGRLQVDDLPIHRAAQSQDAGLRHRKVAIAYRLFLEIRARSWVPAKRTAPSPKLSPRFEMKRQRLRIRLRDLSHVSFERAKSAGDLAWYLNIMKPAYLRYARRGKPLLYKLLSYAKRTFDAFIWKRFLG